MNVGLSFAEQYHEQVDEEELEAQYHEQYQVQEQEYHVDEHGEGVVEE